MKFRAYIGKMHKYHCIAWFGKGKKFFLSDDIKHDTTLSLCALQLIKMKYQVLPLEIFKVIYISDGALGHFKKKYQLKFSKCNQNKEAEWIFTATRDEKSVYDGVDGLCKHYAINFHLQKEPTLAIRNAVSYVDTVRNLLQNVTILFLKIENVQPFRLSKEKEWANIKPVTTDIHTKKTLCWFPKFVQMFYKLHFASCL